MPPGAERSRFRLAVYALLAVLLGLAAIPAYLTLAPSWRPVGARLACAALVIAGCVRVIRGVRRSIEDHPPFALDAPRPPAPPPELNERFVRLRDEVRFSLRSRRYFDTILWPRLARLAGPQLAPPPARRGIRRDGPPLGELERLIAEAEKRA